MKRKANGMVINSMLLKFLRLLWSITAVFLLLAASIYFELPSPALAQSQLFLQPNKGVVGTKVRISGSLLTPSVSGNATVPGVTTFAKVYFPNQETLVATTAIDYGGNFETYINIGEYPAGEHKIWVLDVSASPPSWNSVVFTVLPKIIPSASHGYEGDNVTLSGSGFSGASAVKIYFDSKVLAETTSSVSGNISVQGIILPPSIRGSHLFSVLDAAGNEASVSFMVHHFAELNLSSGPIGTLVSFRGASYLPNSIISVSVNDTPVFTSPSVIRSNPSGNFTGTFYFPSYSVGIYQVRLSDGDEGAAVPFQVTLGGTLNRIVGYAGNAVTYTGSGFVPGRIAVISFNGIPVGEAAVNPGGNVKGEFVVPDMHAGDYDVAVTDGTSKTTHTFKLLGAAAYSINRDSGNVGSEIIITGSRFLPGKVMVFNYDEIPVGEVTISEKGGFTFGFKAPVSKNGQHRITATDGINTVNLTLTIESIAPPAPLPILPLGALEAEVLPVFKWQSVNDASGVVYVLQLATSADFGSANATDIVLTKGGMVGEELNISHVSELPAGEYFWRVKAVDLAENESKWSEVMTFTILPKSAYWFMLSVLAEVGVFSTMFGLWIVRKRRQNEV